MQLLVERARSETSSYLLSTAPRLASQGNSSNVLGLFAIARLFTTGELRKGSPAFFADGAGRSSSGNCSKTLGLFAMARFLTTSAEALFEAERPSVSPGLVPPRDSWGKASTARGLAAMARFVVTSARSNT